MSIKQIHATSSSTGARADNEDFQQVIVTTNFVAVLVLDGHSGSVLKDWFGKSIYQALENLFNSVKADISMEDLVELLKIEYYKTLANVDLVFLKGGTTLSIGIFQKPTRLMFTMQVGDSMIFMSNSQTGDIITACKVFELDIANPGKEIEYGYCSCVTDIFDFSKNEEVELYQKICLENGRKFSVSKRSDCVPLEHRCLAKVDYKNLCEPSRTIENRLTYEKFEFLIDLQRSPVFSVWDLKEIEDPIALCAVCDGFISKLAVPTNHRISQVVINPGLYIQDENCMKDTSMDFWINNNKWWDNYDLIKPDHEKWTEDPVINAAKLVLYIAPDTLWKNAVETAIDTIQNIKNRISLDELNVNGNIQESLNLSVAIPTALASDDNVSCCVVLI
jgi:serine/threonine protein phosphatase PrpC